MLRQEDHRRSPLAHHALAFLGYLTLTLVFMRPAANVLATHLAPDPGDPVFNLVVLKWGIHEMRTGMHGFWNMPFFFPARQVTTFSDHLLGPAAFATLFTAVVNNPLAAYNVLLLGSFVLCGFNTWFVLRHSGLGATAAFLGGCMFAFSPFRWDQLSHVQVLLMQWIPVTLWSWDRLLSAPTWRRAAVFFAFYALHVTGGSYLAYMIHFPMLVFLLIRGPAMVQGGRWRDAARVLVPTGLAAVAVLAVVSLPYLAGSGQRQRSVHEVVSYGASLASYVTPGMRNLEDGDWSSSIRRAENVLFAGILPTVLVLFAAVRGWRRLHVPPLRPLSGRRRLFLAALAGVAALIWLEGDLRVWQVDGRLPLPPALANLPGLHGHALLLPAAAAALLAFGLRRRWGGNWPLRLAELEPWRRGLLISGALCFLLTFPLVYLPLMRVIPGLSGMRVPARFYAFVSFSLVFFAAGEIDRWLRVVRQEAAKRRLALRLAGVTLAAAVLVADLMPQPIVWQPLPQEAQFAPVYHWLASEPDVGARLELPIEDIFTDLSYMYFATLGWKPLVNGYSGYVPAHYADLEENCCYPLPDPDQLARLRRWGVTHVLLHEDSLDKPWKQREALDWAAGQPDVSVEYEDGTDRVYRIAASDVPAR